MILSSVCALEDDLRPLGLYNQKSVALKKIATDIINDYNGMIPTDQQTLAKLPHVGLYISNAVACFCYRKRTAVVDTNVARILARVKGLELPKDAREKWIWKLAAEMLPNEMWREYNFGLLDLGAIICKKLPRCPICPLIDICTYGKNFQSSTVPRRSP